MHKDYQPISRLMLERYLCDEVTWHEKKRIREALRSDDAVRRTIAMLHVSSNEILAAYPAAEMARAIGVRARLHNAPQELLPVPLSRWGWLSSMMRVPLQHYAVAVVVLVLLVAVPVTVFHRNGRMSTSSEAVRVKGLQPYLTVYRQAEGGYEKLSDSATVMVNDRIQLGYVAAGKKYGFIFSVDGNGRITIHYPEDASTRGVKTKLQPGREHFLATSFELDDAPAFERFFFLTADDPIDTAGIIQECERQFDRAVFRNTHASIPFSRPYQQMSVILFKEEQQ